VAAAARDGSGEWSAGEALVRAARRAEGSGVEGAEAEPRAEDAGERGGFRLPAARGFSGEGARAASLLPTRGRGATSARAGRGGAGRGRARPLVFEGGGVAEGAKGVEARLDPREARAHQRQR
jgi:hypothetical protein